MKYQVKNDLSLFEFHDAVFSFVSYDGTDLVVAARMLNVHKEAAVNPEDCDMEIETAYITFRNLRSATYEPGRSWEMDEDGEYDPVGPQVIFRDREAMEKILEELREEIWVYHFVKKEDGCGYCLGGSGIEPYFEIEFDFDGVVVEWDAYKKKAWYELHRRYNFQVTLQTPDGDKTVGLVVNWQEESVYYQGELWQPPSATVSCTLDGKEYWGHGKDYYWVDAFADLQRQLPEGVVIRCCLTCRHGNFCPVGNARNEVFCTKDVQVTQGSEWWHYTEDEGERKKRSRQYCDCCEDYQPQTKGYYTYNDFLHYWKGQ